MQSSNLNIVFLVSGLASHFVSGRLNIFTNNNRIQYPIHLLETSQSQSWINCKLLKNIGLFIQVQIYSYEVEVLSYIFLCERWFPTRTNTTHRIVTPKFCNTYFRPSFFFSNKFPVLDRLSTAQDHRHACEVDQPHRLDDQ